MEDLDKPQESSYYVLIRISADNLAGENPDKESMREYALDFCRQSTMQIATDKDMLVTFEAWPMENFVWFDTEEEAEKHRRDRM